MYNLPVTLYVYNRFKGDNSVIIHAFVLRVSKSNFLPTLIPSLLKLFFRKFLYSQLMSPVPWLALPLEGELVPYG